MPFGIHRDDRSNSAVPPDVVCRSVVLNETRYVINGQNKKSMDQLHERVVETKDITNDLLEMYGTLPKERKAFGPWTSKRKKEEVNGFEISTDRCNMDPTSFMQPTLYGVSRLTEHFRLSHLEIHSSQIAGTYVPNVKYFIVIAAELLIVMNQCPSTGDSTLEGYYCFWLTA
jgi:hypothetical protein